MTHHSCASLWPTPAACGKTLMSSTSHMQKMTGWRLRWSLRIGRGHAAPVATMSAASRTSSSKGGGFASSMESGMSSSDWVCCGCRCALSCRKRSHSRSRNFRELALLGSNSRHLFAWMMALHAVVPHCQAGMPCMPPPPSGQEQLFPTLLTPPFHLLSNFVGYGHLHEAGGLWPT